MTVGSLMETQRITYIHLLNSEARHDADRRE